MPRPPHSPRSLPVKRPLELDQEVSDLEPLTSPAKCVKFEAAASSPGCFELVSQPETPERPEVQSKFSIVTPPKEKPHSDLDEALEQAFRIFKRAWEAYALDRDRKNEDHADLQAEDWVAENYGELRDVLLDLLPWIGHMKADEAGGDYDVIHFQGFKTPPQILQAAKLVQGTKQVKEEELLAAQMQHMRTSSEQSKAWEGLSAVLAALSSRKEKTWLEPHDTEKHIEKRIKDYPKCKDRRSEKRKDAIREILAEYCSKGYGYFAHALAHPASKLRLTFARGEARPLPATFMITQVMPLWEAFQAMDDNGPFTGAAMSRAWCLQAGREFALQELQFGYEEGSIKERQHVASLKPDTKLRALLRSTTPVLYLDSIAALAPREVCRKQGLSDIVKAELATLLREAKSRKQAVVFFLGSDSPHKLAEKVYLRPPLADFGLRCGCLRWRESADAPWAREMVGLDRLTLCLQMP